LVTSDWFSISTFAIELLVILVLRLLAGTGALVAVDALHNIVTAIGGGVSVAKAQP
jgi:hypothetical protein